MCTFFCVPHLSTSPLPVEKVLFVVRFLLSYFFSYVAKQAAHQLGMFVSEQRVRVSMKIRQSIYGSFCTSTNIEKIICFTRHFSFQDNMEDDDYDDHSDGGNNDEELL